MEQRVFEIVAQMASVDPTDINRDSSMDNVETWDSLVAINLVLALEEEFGVRFTDEQINQLSSVRAIMEALQELVGQA